tara:strand:- start:765 stop:2036 length:1272 start_codon:yes stop_codon:yes gene_type:complete
MSYIQFNKTTDNYSITTGRVINPFNKELTLESSNKMNIIANNISFYGIYENTNIEISGNLNILGNIYNTNLINIFNNIDISINYLKNNLNKNFDIYIEGPFYNNMNKYNETKFTGYNILDNDYISIINNPYKDISSIQPYLLTKSNNLNYNLYQKKYISKFDIHNISGHVIIETLENLQNTIDFDLEIILFPQDKTYIKYWNYYDISNLNYYYNFYNTNIIKLKTFTFNNTSDYQFFEFDVNLHSIIPKNQKFICILKNNSGHNVNNFKTYLIDINCSFFNNTNINYISCKSDYQTFIENNLIDICNNNLINIENYNQNSLITTKQTDNNIQLFINILDDISNNSVVAMYDINDNYIDHFYLNNTKTISNTINLVQYSNELVQINFSLNINNGDYYFSFFSDYNNNIKYTWNNNISKLYFTKN